MKTIFMTLFFLITCSFLTIAQTSTLKENKRDFIIKLIETKTYLTYAMNTENITDCRFKSLVNAEESFKEVEKLYELIKANISLNAKEKYDGINNVYKQVAKATSFEYLTDPSTMTAIVISNANVEVIIEEMLK